MTLRHGNRIRQTGGKQVADEVQDLDVREPAASRERTVSFDQDNAAAITESGFLKAVTRVDALLAARGEPLPFSLIELGSELVQDYKPLLPDISRDDARRIRGAQDLIVTRQPAAAIKTLPELLADQDNRRRFLALLERVLSDPRMRDGMSPAQTSTLQRIRALVSGTGALHMQARPGPGLQDGAILAPHAAGAQP